MKPRVFVNWNSNCYGPFEDDKPILLPQKSKTVRHMQLIGQIASSPGERYVSKPGSTAEVYQDIIVCPMKVKWFCPSEWNRYPPEHLWHNATPRLKAEGEGDVFLTYVTPGNLKFEGTTFQQRYRYFCGGNVCPILKELAEKEELERGNRKEFVYFKSPSPDGYQGVYGNFESLIYGVPPPDSNIIDHTLDSEGQIAVYDRNNPTHVLEVG